MRITPTCTDQGSTHPIFFLVEVNNLMDWRRRNDILDSKIPSSFNTSSLLRPAEESLGGMFSAVLSPWLICKKRDNRSHFIECHRGRVTATATLAGERTLPRSGADVTAALHPVYKASVAGSNPHRAQIMQIAYVVHICWSI